MASYTSRTGTVIRRLACRSSSSSVIAGAARNHALQATISGMGMPSLVATYSTVAAEDQHYVSPFEEFIGVMERNGPTTLGTRNDECYDSLLAKTDKKLRCGVPVSAIRFSTTTFGRTLMEPFVHPCEHRVVMKVNTKHLPLNMNGIDREILREIVGTRLNDERNELRLSSAQFGSRIENKRHLVTMLDRIILSCQRLAKEIELENSSTAAAREEAA